MKDEYSRGFIALITVLIVTGAAMVIAVSQILGSISQALNDRGEYYSTQAWASANGCIEHALGDLSSATATWNTYAGEAGLSVGPTICSLAVSGGGANPLVLKASSTAGIAPDFYTRRIQVTVATNTPVSTISNWQEVAD